MTRGEGGLATCYVTKKNDNDDQKKLFTNQNLKMQRMNKTSANGFSCVIFFEYFSFGSKNAALTFHSHSKKNYHLLSLFLRNIGGGSGFCDEVLRRGGEGVKNRQKPVT